MSRSGEEQAPGIARTHMLGPDASGTTGRDLGEPGSGAGLPMAGSAAMHSAVGLVHAAASCASMRMQLHRSRRQGAFGRRTPPLHNCLALN